MCDGHSDCSDNSDEGSDVCSNHYCPSYAYRCAYGGCVQGVSRCNRIIDCWDGSDEAEALCGRPPPVVTPSTPPQSGSCRIPTIEDGHVVATFSRMVVPPNDLVVNGQSVEFVCKEGNTNVSTNCINGEFINELPRCTDGCSTLKLDTISVQARCMDKGLISIPCSAVVPKTTFAVFECKTGYERPPGKWQESIHCLENGEWSGHVPRCEPKCGQITFGVPFISGGHVTNISQVPWHVAVYERPGLGDDDEYTQICGGSIISQTAVISAAHCFWDENFNRLKDAALFSVIAGKSFRDYKLVEPGMQVVKVQEIRINAFLGNTNLYSADIAVLRLTKPIIYQTFIVPICLKFLQFAAKVRPTESDTPHRPSFDPRRSVAIRAFFLDRL